MVVRLRRANSFLLVALMTACSPTGPKETGGDAGVLSESALCEELPERVGQFVRVPTDAFELDSVCTLKECSADAGFDAGTASGGCCNECTHNYVLCEPRNRVLLVDGTGTSVGCEGDECTTCPPPWPASELEVGGIFRRGDYHAEGPVEYTLPFEFAFELSVPPT